MNPDATLIRATIASAVADAAVTRARQRLATETLTPTVRAELAAFVAAWEEE